MRRVVRDTLREVAYPLLLALGFALAALAACLGGGGRQNLPDRCLIPGCETHTVDPGGWDDE